jgi:hypothetical protein
MLISIVAGLIYVPTECIRIPFPCILSAFVVVFFMIANLTGVKWNLNVILICFSFMTKNIEQFFIIY